MMATDERGHHGGEADSGGASGLARPGPHGAAVGAQRRLGSRLRTSVPADTPAAAATAEMVVPASPASETAVCPAVERPGLLDLVTADCAEKRLLTDPDACCPHVLDGIACGRSGSLPRR